MKVLAAIGLLAIIFAVVASLYFFGGFYSVAANREDPAIVHWALMKVRTNSIVHHAQDQPPAGFDDPAKVQTGARAFSELGCINCHGAPGVKWAKFSEGLQPDPPDAPWQLMQPSSLKARAPACTLAGSSKPEGG